MIKKLFLLFIFLISSIAFSQEKSIDKLMAYPNPFSNATKISFDSSNNQNILISIKNVLGNTVFLKQVEAREGKNTITFNRNDLRSGMYIYAIQSNTDFISKRFVIR